MKKILFLLLQLLIFLTSIGCYSTTDKKKYVIKKLEKELKVEISNDIKIKNYEIGRNVESFVAYLEKDEFYRIINELNLKKCLVDTSAYCFQTKQERGSCFVTISISFYPKNLLVSYFYYEI